MPFSFFEFGLGSSSNFVREGAAEGGCGGNSAAPEPEAKPRRLLVQSRAKQNTLFLLEEKNGGARKEKIVKSILLGGERQRAAAGRSGWFRSGISDKMSSSGVVKTHQYQTFRFFLLKGKENFFARLRATRGAARLNFRLGRGGMISTFKYFSNIV